MGLGDAELIYWVVHRLVVSRGWRLEPALLNPLPCRSVVEGDCPWMTLAAKSIVKGRLPLGAEPRVLTGSVIVSEANGTVS